MCYVAGVDAKALRREAAENRAQARRLRETADALERQADVLEGLAERADGIHVVLHKRKQSGTVNDMTNDHALAISKTQRGKDRKFRSAMHEAGFTQNSLAARLGISSASLTRYRDKRPAPRAIVDKVQALTGYDGPWPGGVVD